MSDDRFRYEKLAAELREAILSGQYQPGSQLPTKNQLQQRLQDQNGTKSLGTVNKAIGVLKSEGLVNTHAGRGTFVADPLPDITAPSERDQLVELIEALREELRDMSARLKVVEDELEDTRGHR